MTEQLERRKCDRCREIHDLLYFLLHKLSFMLGRLIRR
jgi:hypothetical protein